MDDTLGKDKSVEMLDKLKEETENIICDILEEGIKMDNIEMLDKVVDIHKDIANEEYWEVKKEDIDMRYMRGSYNDGRGGNYGNYGNYGRDSNRESGDGSYGRRRRDSRGRYMEGGRSGNYRGHEMLEDMQYNYGEYSEGRERYGTDKETMESFKYMLKSFKDYYKHLKQEASSQQEVEMLEDVAREISEM